MLLSLSTLLFANFALGIAYPYYASSDYHQVQNGVKRRTYVPAAIPSHTDRRFHQKSFNPHDPNCQHSDNIFDLNSMWQPAEHTNYVYQNQMPPSPQATWPPQYHAPICATYPFCPQAQQTNTLPRTHTYLLYQGQPTYSLVQQQPQKRRFYYLTNVQNYQPNYEGQFIYARPAVTFRTAPKVPEPEVKLPDPDDARFITQGPETDEDDFTPTTEGPAVTQTAAPSVRPTARTSVPEPEDEETETSTSPSTDDYKDTSETTPGAETTATKEAKETEVKIKPASADDDDDEEDVLEDKFANDQVTTGPTATGQEPEVTTRPPRTPTQVQEGEGETGGDSLPEPDEEDTDDDDKKEVAEGRATADSDPDTETSPETAAEPEGEKPEIAEAKDDEEKDDEEKDEEEKDEDDDEKDEDSGSTLTVIRPADQLSPALKQQIEDLKRKDKEDREAKALEDSEEKFVDDEDDGQAETQEGQAEGQSGQEATEKPEEAAPTTAEARRGDLGDDYDY
ncbi:hypothetical protein HDE_04991 [Halotydeus destructor]|nr:hypothetical protein HDE_04991 [Halotydeus destructor]